MHALNRRQMLARTALAGLAAPALLAQTARAIDPIARSRPSHLKLSLAAYSYRQLLTARPPKLDLFGFADLAADLGLDAIEPTSYYFPADVNTDYLHRLKVHAFKLGLDISGTAVGNNFCVPEGPQQGEQLMAVKAWIDRAVQLDAPVIRIFAGNTPKGDTEDAAVDRAIGLIREAVAHAESMGVVLALENHGGVTTRPEQLLRIVHAVDSPNFGVNLDTGNFRGGDPYADMARLAPYAVNVQVKTEVTPEGGKKVDADLGRIVGILREAKYSGYVVLEYEAEEDPLEAIPRHVEELRSLIG